MDEHVRREPSIPSDQGRHLQAVNSAAAIVGGRELHLGATSLEIMEGLA
jgi:hypothetical protein